MSAVSASVSAGVPAGVPAGVQADAHAWMPAATCTTRRCLPRSAPTVGRPRRYARWAALVCVLLLGVALCRLVRGDRPIRAWSRAVVRALGVRVRISGAVPAEGPVLVVANHTSWLDVPLLAAVRPGRMLAKSEVAAYPVLGRLARRGGTLFIDRARLRTLPDAVARIAAALRAGSAVVAFPEGSTWCGRRHGAFRRAVFQAAYDAGVPVQPVVVRYRLVPRGRRVAPGAPDAAADPYGVSYADSHTDSYGGRSAVTGPAAVTAVTAFVGDDTLLASLRRVAAARGVLAEITVLPPLAPGAYADRRALAGAAARAVAAAGNLPDYGSCSGDEGEERR
ncbi:lysophospholipid acyltransferase family protein [Streptomyces armeniacus]|uniref:lysophospholipid acyltransferase family protein n=1 Tax=Streptomyces armeniacus TaxID=83291 RepID=UPI001FE5902A|nr:lysophospholipid acyltransferase family protein [Streptomyces armeniacus]